MRSLLTALIVSLLALSPTTTIPLFSASPAYASNEGGKKHRKSRSYADKLRGRTKKPQAKPKKKPKYKSWKEVTKDAEVHEGLFKVYKKREDLYFEIKKDQLDKPFLGVLSLSRGIGAKFVLGGLPIDDIMFDFHRVDDHVLVRRLNTLFRAGGDPALSKAIELTFGNSILFSLKIESENDSTGSLLVKMNEVFLSDLPDISYFMRNVLKKPVRLDKKKGFFSQVKVFPKNVEIEATLTYSPGDRKGLYLPSVPDERYIEIGVHYSLNLLPETPMKPRQADDRVGYFITAFKDYTRDDQKSFMVHYVNRWRLEKKDPGAELSEPKQPIVFYIDSTIPEKYRPYVAAGVEEWQRAFEEAGFLNAIVARDAPDDPDFDPEDARYNTIRWVTSDSPTFGAIGPSRVDPRTGEILDADVLIEASMIAGFYKVYQRYAGPESILRQDPFLRFLGVPIELPGAGAGGRKLEQPAPALDFGLKSQYFCDIGQGFAQGADFLRIVLLMRGMVEGGLEVPEEYIGEALKEVTMHEVGHTLGLRHNFKSSTAVPYDKLNDKETIEQIGMTGSVMDYATPNVAKDRSKQGYFYSPTVGTYDRWAIKWGYIQVSGDDPAEETRVLERIAKQAYKTENIYGTDEDTYPSGALDPRCNIWDLGDDPLRFAADRLAVVDDLIRKGKLEDRIVARGEDYSSLRAAVQTLLIQRYIAVGMALKYIGGQYTTRAHRGDPGGQLPFRPVSVGEQRKALRFLVENAFAPDAFVLPPELLDKLVDDKLWDWQNNPFSYGRRFDFPMLSWVSALQYALLVKLFNPMLLQRIQDEEYRFDKPLRLSELFGSLTRAIWLADPTPSGRTAAVQRNLQRMYLSALIRMVVHPWPGTPDDAVALARLNLRRIDQAAAAAFRKPGLSDETNAHLMETRARIKRALEAKVEAAF